MVPRVVIVLPLSPLALGDRFAVQDWPLHITVLAPFETDAAPELIAQAIASATSDQEIFVVIAGRDELFGRREDVPVTAVVENPTLTALHRTLVEAVRPLATFPGASAFAGTEFRAHVTVKDPWRVMEGDRLSLSQIALVDMAPRRAPEGRSVLATIDLMQASG